MRYTRSGAGDTHPRPPNLDSHRLTPEQIRHAPAVVLAAAAMTARIVAVGYLESLIALAALYGLLEASDDHVEESIRQNPISLISLEKV